MGVLAKTLPTPDRLKPGICKHSSRNLADLFSIVQFGWKEKAAKLSLQSPLPEIPEDVISGHMYTRHPPRTPTGSRKLLCRKAHARDYELTAIS